jgi:hypothetical protein
MNKFFKKIKEAYPKCVLHVDQNYLNFSIGASIVYQLRIQKDVIRIMAWNYPKKLKISEAIKVIKSEKIEGKKVNEEFKIMFKVGVKNPEIFTLRIEIPFKQSYLNKDEFIFEVIKSCEQFHLRLMPLINAFQPEPVDKLGILMSLDNSIPKKNNSKEKKAKEVELNEDITTQFRESYTDEEELANYMGSCMEDFLEKGKIVVLEIKEKDLINITKNHDLLSSDLLTMVGIVGKKSLQLLSKLIGKEESDWVKNEFIDEDPMSIALLYCNAKYVYAFSDPNNEDSVDDITESTTAENRPINTSTKQEKIKSSKSNSISKVEKGSIKKKFVLNYWMDERINYKSENEKYIIEGDIKKMTNMGSLYGTNGFYIDVTPKKIYKVLAERNGYDFKSLKNHFIYYQEYCNGMGAIEIETNSPDSIIPHKVKNGLIQSVIDKDGQEFFIYKHSDFLGELNHYDTPEFNYENFLVLDKSIEQSQILNSRLVPIDYDSWCKETSISFYSDKWVLIVEFFYCFSLNLNSKDSAFLEAIDMITPSQIQKLKIYKELLAGIKKWYLAYDNYKSLDRLKLLAKIIKNEFFGLDEPLINTLSAGIYTLHKSQDKKVLKLCNSILNILK